jgi:hypothetical protein
MTRQSGSRCGKLIRLAGPSIGVLTLVILALCAPTAWAQEPRPGAGDPAATYAKWPDDEIFLGLPLSGPEVYDRVQGYQASSDLSTLTQLASYDVGESGPLVATSGRFLTAEHDDVIYAQGSSDFGGMVKLDLFGRDSTNQPLLPDVALDMSPKGACLDIASGELDRLPDADTGMRDELVVAYGIVGTSAHVGPARVAVVDYGATTPDSPVGRLAATTQTSAQIDGESMWNQTIALPDTDCVHVATADLDGDGHKEIVVAMLTGPKTLGLEAFRYEDTGGGTYGLRSLQTLTAGPLDDASYRASAWHGAFALAAGDFDGDGKEELALGTTSHGKRGPLFINAATAYDLLLFKAGAAGTLALVKQERIDMASGALPSPTPFLGRVVLASGLFRYDRANGFHLNRRQLAVAARVSDLDAAVWVIQVQGEPGSPTLVQGPHSLTTLGFDSDFWISAGGFKGLRTGTDPLWSVGLGFVDDGTYGLGLLEPQATAGGQVTLVARTMQTLLTGVDVGGGAQYPLERYDPDGDSISIGAPVHMTLEQVKDIRAILQEPPKHAFWNKETQAVETVSRYDDFYVEFTDSQEKSFSSTTKKHSDYSVGGSETASVAMTLKKPGLLVSTQMDAKVSETFGYDYEHNSSSYNSAYGEQSWSLTRRSDHDDIMVANNQLLDIWRYRVYGYQAKDEAGNPTNAYYDVVLPGPDVSAIAAAGAKNFDGWEPVWENGNILSYPEPSGSTYTPPDLGSFKIPCLPGPSDPECIQVGTDPITGTKTLTSAMAWGEEFWDGTSGDRHIEMTSGTGAGSEHGYTHKLNGSVDVSVGATVKIASVMKVSAEADVEFHGGTSWGKLTTEDSETNETRGVTLHTCSGESIKAYSYYPVLYITKDGAAKLTYAVNPTGSALGRDWWLRTYGSGPDPALNLPERFVPTYSPTNVQNGWKPNMDPSRNRIRGFFVKQPELEPVIGEYPLLGHAAKAGEPVRLEVRVYNYSLSVVGGVAALDVRFDAVLFDPATGQEDATTRYTIGETTLTNLLPRQIQVAAIEWTPTMTGIPVPGTSQTWHIRVILDPRNEVPNEIYESESAATRTYCEGGECIDPGQNNEGWREVQVIAPPLPGDPQFGKPGDAHLREGALAAIDRRGKLTTKTTQATLGEPLDLRIQVSSDNNGQTYSEVLLYDGDPAQGGELIADKQVLPGTDEASGNFAWVSWTPRSLEPHQLYAVLLETADDTAPGNNVAQLKVIVHKPPAPKKVK